MAKQAAAVGWWRQQARFWGHPSALLLLVQLLQVVLYPAAAGLHAARALLDFVGIVVLLLALRLIHHTRGFVWHATVVGALVIALDIAHAATGVTALQGWQAAAEALLYFYTARCLIGYMLADRRATADELFAAAATFTLLVWAFTQLLVLCQLLQPDAFTGAAVAGGLRSWSELTFLSFALFTSTGIGAVVPMTAASRAIGDIEMFAGVMYLALVVSRLIGLAVGGAARRGARESKHDD